MPLWQDGTVMNLRISVPLWQNDTAMDLRVSVSLWQNDTVMDLRISASLWPEVGGVAVQEGDVINVQTQFPAY